MRIRISTLAENSVSGLKFLAEWGLSILVEADDAVILVDTGRSTVAAYNARLMGCDLSRLDKIVLSHGHEDHAGGLLELLKLRNRPESPVGVIAHPDVWIPKYKGSADRTRFDEIGIPYSRKLAESLGAVFQFSREPVWITDRIVTSGEVPMVTDFERIDESACVRSGDGYSADPLNDDLSLFIKTDQGLVVVAGCAHRGIVNTILRGKEITGCKQIHTVIGGIHLYSATPERIERTISEFKRLDIRRIGVSHCTGQAASMRMSREFGDHFFFNQAGTTMEFEA